MRLLVTRPEPDNERTAAMLRARGHEVMLAPLLRIEVIADADLGAPPFAAILLTSANGARAASAHPRRSELIALPVLAVGSSSADAARMAGFANVESADGDGRGLARLAAKRFAGAGGAAALSRRRESCPRSGGRTCRTGPERSCHCDLPRR
jgi:uroporphyrinogen-III synthase